MFTKKSIALLLGSTAIATTMSFDVVARAELTAVEGLDARAGITYVAKTFATAQLGMDSKEVDALLNVVSPQGLIAEVKAPQADQSAEERQRLAHMPLVMEAEDGSRQINPLFEGVKTDQLQMNHLSYQIAKRQALSDQLNQMVAALHMTQMEWESLVDEMESEFGFCALDIELELLSAEHRKAKLIRDINAAEIKMQGILAQEEEVRQLLIAAGWDVEAFEGMAGYKLDGSEPGKHWVKDDRGFVAFHPEKNMISVVVHGSRNNDDWNSNFDARKVRASECGLDLPGDHMIHRGFGNVAGSYSTAVKGLVKKMLDKVDAEKRGDTQVFVTGHSLGAALASLTVADLANSGEELFGEGYNNAERNNIKGLFVSTPRAHSPESASAIEQLVGKSNMVRQNVHGDPVPNSLMLEAEQKLISLVKFLEGDRQLGSTGLARVPLIGGWLEAKLIDFINERPGLQIFLKENAEDALKQMTGYSSVGELALHDAGDALTRKLGASLWYFTQRTANNFGSVVKGYYDWFTGKETNANGFLVFGKNTIRDLIATVVAPYHYGSTVAGGSGSFDWDLPNVDTNVLLAAGKAHLDAKAAGEPEDTRAFVKRASGEAQSTAGKVTEKVGGWFAAAKTVYNVAKGWFGR